MNRRVAVLALVALGAAPLAVRAQGTARIYRVGILHEGSRPHRYVPEFVRGLHELGYREGENLKLEYRSTEDAERLSALAAELVRLNVDVIFAFGTRSALAAKRATTHIPSDLIGKLLELAKETVPAATRVAILASSTNPATASVLQAAEAAAGRLGLKTQVVDIRRREDIPAAFSALAKRKPNAMVATRGVPLTPIEITGFAMKACLPAVYESSDFADAGGLMSYGASLTDQFKRTAVFIDKILRGAKPADLPVEQASNFALVINRRTARQLGLSIPADMLIRADGVIE